MRQVRQGFTSCHSLSVADERCSAEQIKKFYLWHAQWKLVLDLGSDDEVKRNWPIGPDEFDELIAQKIRKAKTDPEALPSEAEGLEGRLEAQNLVGIYAALADSDVDTVLREFGGRGFGDFKPALAELAVARLSPMGQEMRRLLANPGDIDAILDDGAARAEAIAAPIIAQVNEIVGFLGPAGGR